MSRLRNILRRNRGLIVALAVVLVALPATSKLWLTGPRVSWTEVIRPSKEPVEFGEFTVFSPDGRFAFTSDPTRAHLRDLTTGLLRELSPGELGHGLWSNGAEFLEGGRFILGHLRQSRPGGPDVHSVRIWEAASGREWARISDVGDDSASSNYVISAGGSTYACPPRFERKPTGKTRSVGVWKSAWGGEIRKFPGVNPIALSADGRFLAAGGPGEPMASVLIHDVDAGRLVATIPVEPSDQGRCLALSADGKLLAEDRPPGTVLWDVPTATRRAVLETQTWPVRFGAGDSLLYLGNLSTDQEPSEVWNLAAKPPRLIFRGATLHVSPDGRRIVRSSPDAPRSPIVDGPAELVEFLPTGQFGRSDEGHGLKAVFSPDGVFAASFEKRTEFNRSPRFLRYLPRTLRPAPARTREVQQILVIDTRSGREVAKVDPPGAFTGYPDYNLLADGKTLAVAYVLAAGQGGPDATSTVQLWDVPGRSAWPVAAGLAWAAVVVGVGFDVRARRRAARAHLSA